MAEEKDRLIFEIELKENDTRQKVKELKAELDTLKQQKKDLQTLNKNGVLSNEKYAESLAEVEGNTKKVNDELKKNTRTLELQQKANDDSIGYINQLRARLSLLTVQWAGLSEEELKNAKTGGVLSKEMKNISDELKDLEKGVGDTRRNVGNYREDIEKALSTQGNFFDQVKAGVGVLGSLRDEYTKQSESFGEYREQLKGQLTEIKATIAGLNGAKVASGGATLATKAFGLALKATGIGLIVAALAGLIAFLTRSQEGMDFVARKTAAASAVFNVFLNKIIPVGKALLAAFTNPQQALKDLGRFLVDNVINRFTAFKVILDGIVNLDFKKLTNGLLQAVTGVENLLGKVSGLGSDVAEAATQADKLTAASQRLREAERAINVERAKSRAEIERLKLISEDTTKSQQVREQAAKKAFDIENNLLKRQTAVQKERIANLKAEAAQGQITAEVRDKIAEEEIKLAEIAEDSLGKQTELNNSLNSIRQEGADKAKENAEKIAQAEQENLDNLVKQIELRTQIAKLKGEDTTELEIQGIRATAKAEANQFKKNADVRKLIEQKAEADITKLRTDKEAERLKLSLETKQAGIDAQLALVEKGTVKELLLIKQSIWAGAELQKENAKQQITDKVRLDAELARIDATTKRAIIDAEKDFVEQQTAIAEGHNERRVRIQKDLTDRMKNEILKRNQDNLDANAVELIGAKEGSKKELDLRIAAVKQRAAMELQNEHLTANQRKLIQKQANKEIEDLQKAYVVNIANQIVQIGEQVNNALSIIAEAQSKVQLSNLDKQQKAALSSAGLNADLREKIEKDFAGKREKIEKEAAEKRRKIALAESYINEAKAIINIIATAANPILAGFLVAAAHFTAAQNRAIIQTQEFALGGVPGYQSDGRGAYVQGPGSGTSDSITAKISKGESVVNARSTEMFYPLLSAINQIGGGRAFPQGPKINPSTAFSYGGVASSGKGAEIDVEALKTAFTAALREMPNPVVAVEDVSNKLNKVRVKEVRNDR